MSISRGSQVGLQPEPGFAELTPLFQREVDLVDSAGDLDVDAWEAVQSQICQTVALVKPDGQEVADFILHIRGDEASFRWSDEPLGTEWQQRCCSGGWVGVTVELVA
ncbi:hypothetical protein ACQP2C_15230 [Micromonospora zamorensis]|uniref:hypothetical protein n=1 Tax=Micromonospora zamorensis TaxID=709883 RepID=UPI003D962C3B